jgi:isoleucyl-tRNA synthetase
MEELHEGKTLKVMLAGEAFSLLPEDVEIKQVAHEGWIAMHAGNITLALDTELNEELILEGIARELINKINTMRRDAGLAVTDRIIAHIASTELVRKALKQHVQYIKEEVLAVDIHETNGEKSSEWDINGELAQIAINKVIS